MPIRAVERTEEYGDGGSVFFLLGFLDASNDYQSLKFIGPMIKVTLELRKLLEGPANNGNKVHKSQEI